MMHSGATASLLDQDGDGDLDDDDIDGLYNECDVDGSGSITLDELHGALKKRLNAGAAFLVAQKLVKMADQDGEGTISRGELRDAVKRLQAKQARGDGDDDPDDEKVSLELSFHHWIGQVFVPSAKAAIKKKKMKAVADLMAAKKK